MKPLRFSWNERKNKTNQKKHGIFFEEAQTIFFDESAIEYYDPDYSEDEDRFLMLGLSCRIRALVVPYCLREEGDEIRIISSRKATKKEQEIYFGGKQ